MGPTSSWAFCQRVLATIRVQSSERTPTVRPWTLESVSLRWSPIGLDEQPDVGNLPSVEYAALLHSTVKYHLGSLYDIVDHDSFSQHMDRFYRDPANEARKSRFWYAQLLFVLAFGEAFISAGSAKPGAGLRYASRGLSLLPCTIPLDGKTLAAVEALCLAALYLQALDSRLTAFQLVGQALRVCIIEGWHRHMPPSEVTSAHAKRCTSVFWTAYMIDREFGTLIGAPSSIRDEDITVQLPSEPADNSAKAEALALQVKMARLTAMILSGVYGVNSSHSRSLLSDTQSALHGIALVDKELLVYLDTRFRGTDIRTSKVATNLILSYHHCVVLATRPLVMCILHKSLANRGTRMELPEGPIVSLLRSCTRSALNILRTLKALGESNMLDHFLSFQLEAAFSSALMLYIIDKLIPDFTADGSWLRAVQEIFDIMISKGSPAAPRRNQEFQKLRHAMDMYMEQGTSELGNTSTLRQQEAEITLESDARSSRTVPHHSIDGFASWGPLEHYSDFTLSSADIMDLANGLQVDDFLIPDC
ncbi:hypothetical protein BJY01DRAFT_261680 [Aspergillus pseudoustus]|uniref:Xylanolytic transcriptional activator regulatory domain-containing protein n=1 Tax=Aspergillus pseudoustus TaxID=1810923 RepID=A0ABR4KEJ0_9EURO